MARNTEFRNAGSKFGSTIRQSLDLITGRNVNNYTLLFMDPTKQHKRGESKNIVVPYIVLGRNTSCHVQYGDEYPTVSRQHASIQSDDKGCMLIHNPQATNPTYVDGRPISGYHSLESGDEIQLSQDGPRVRFIMDKTAKTSTIGFTRRMSMAIGQSLRPYKRALYIAGVLLIGVLAYSVWSTLRIGDLKEKQEMLEMDLKNSADSINSQALLLEELKLSGEENSARFKETEANLNQTKARSQSLQSQINSVKRQLGNQGSPTYDGSDGGGYSSTPQAGSSSSDASEHRYGSSDDGSDYFPPELEAMEEYIYYIQVVDIILNRPDPYSKLEPRESTFTLAKKWSGTGFLTSDGKFITARHVVEPWLYFQENCGFEAVINDFINDGWKVGIKFQATSSSKHSFTFTNEDLRSDQSSDEFFEVECGFTKKKSYKMKLTTPRSSATDWAYFDLNIKPSNMRYDRELSKNLKKGETLYILGYPGGLHLQNEFSKDALDPLFSKLTVGQSGIKNGVLNVTESSIIGGHSGGPVFAKRGNEYVVVGIVSAVIDKTIGVIVPITNIW